ncbi:MAG: hypothetical protein WC107_03050 [Patescibacteria group bacterium]
MIDLNNTNWKNIESGLSKYLHIMHLFMDTNVQTNSEFQRLFNGFYKIRQRPKEFYQALYDYLEQNKNKKASFAQTLSFFYEKLNRFEPSFSSKIVATINPGYPVWDSVVLKRLNLKSPVYSSNRDIRLNKMNQIYEDIINWYSIFLTTEEAEKMLITFDAKMGSVNISDIKKIDLILWQTRS